MAAPAEPAHRALAPEAPRDGVASAIALAGLALGLVSTGVLPLGPRAWGLALWQYLPPAAGAAACLALAALCSSRARRAVLRLLAKAAPALAGRRRGAKALGWLGLALLFWSLRERILLGDANILLYAASRGFWFHLPDVGATLIVYLAVPLSRLFDSADRVPFVQAFVCAAGVASVACVPGIASRIAPPARRHAAAALMLCGGVSRVWFGHVEVYAFVLLGASAYLLAALRCLRGEAGAAPAALALGVAVWVHPSCLALAPTLPLAAWYGARARGRPCGLLRASAWLGVAAIPVLVFLLGVWLVGSPRTVAQVQRSLAELTGQTRLPTRWVLWPGATPGHATELVLFSPAHLRFLANSFAILAPFALPLVALHALRRPASLWARPETLLLSVAAAGSALYALALRPMWGPFDWDLFSLTAFCLLALAAALLCEVADATRFAHRALAVCAASLLVAAIPWIAIGIHPTRDAGPFTRQRIEQAPGEDAFEALGRHVAPFL